MLAACAFAGGNKELTLPLRSLPLPSHFLSSLLFANALEVVPSRLSGSSLRLSSWAWVFG